MASLSSAVAALQNIVVVAAVLLVGVAVVTGSLY